MLPRGSHPSDFQILAVTCRICFLDFNMHKNCAAIVLLESAINDQQCFKSLIACTESVSYWNRWSILRPGSIPLIDLSTETRILSQIIEYGHEAFDDKISTLFSRARSSVVPSPRETLCRHLSQPVLDEARIDELSRLEATCLSKLQCPR